MYVQQHTLFCVAMPSANQGNACSYLLNDKHVIAAIAIMYTVGEEETKVVLIGWVGGGEDVHNKSVCGQRRLLCLVQMQQRCKVWAAECVGGCTLVQWLMMNVFGLHGGELDRQAGQRFVGAVHCRLLKVFTTSPGCWNLGSVSCRE